MKCREYIFVLTSGQLDEAGWSRRLEAASHRWSCRRCRAFTRNDTRLSEALRAHRERLQTPDAGPIDPPA